MIKTKDKQLNFRIDDDLAAEFEGYCLERDISMTKFFENAIRQALGRPINISPNVLGMDSESARRLDALEKRQWEMEQIVTLMNSSNRLTDSVEMDIDVRLHRLNNERDKEIASAHLKSGIRVEKRNYFPDELDLGDVPGQVFIYSDRIEVHAFTEKLDSFEAYLPKGGQYQGDGVWIYRKSKEREFGKRGCFQGMPVIHEPEI